MKNLLSNKYIRYSFILLGGIFLGWLFFHSPAKGSGNLNQASKTVKTEIWTCSMHPQIRMNHPGKCPICGMDLVPLSQGSISIDPDAIHMTMEAVELANVLTTVVSIQNPVKDIRLYGKVQADERLMQSQVSYVPGRIEKLLVNFTGELVHKGQTLALIYSPDLVTAQQELLETAKTKNAQPLLYQASKEKLHQWKLTENQISDIESSGKVKTDFEITSARTGTVSARRVNTGDYVTAGSVLYEIADLSQVWIQFDAYESDLPYLSLGQKVSFTIQALPGIEYAGAITFIDPVLDRVTRVARVRVEINNQGGKLKPEMFASGTVKANLNQYHGKLVIPSSAVLWTGKRSVVYVKQLATGGFAFKIREIELGPMLGNNYVVESGLADGEEIVTQGAFNVDASAQLDGKPSMMNPKMANDSMRSMSSNRESPGKPALDGKSAISTSKNSVFKVSGNCGMCKDRIEKAARSVKGVSAANWDIKSKKLTIKYDSELTNSTAIQKVISIAGHDTPMFKATDKVYNSLPDCCKYRK